MTPFPTPSRLARTLILSSGSHGKYLGRVDLEVKNGVVVDHNSTLIPVFADVVEPDKEMAAKIAEVRGALRAGVPAGSSARLKGCFTGAATSTVPGTI